MTTSLAANLDASRSLTGDETMDYVTLTIDGQLFGIPVLSVQDMLGPQNVTRVPLASSVVAGSLNLRGRIVTAIDVRKRLGLPPRPNGEAGMNIVVEHQGELYSLVIDAIGEVLGLRSGDYESNPTTLDAVWRDFSVGIYRLEKELLIVLDVGRLLDV